MRSRQGWDNGILYALLSETGMVVMVMMMMAVVGMNHNHYLRLRRIRYCEAEDENESQQNLFHVSSIRRPIFEY